MTSLVSFKIPVFYPLTGEGGLVLYAIFQLCLVIYGGQFPHLEEHFVPGSEPATFR